MAHGRCHICDDPMTSVDREAMAERDEQARKLGQAVDEDREPICRQCQDREDDDEAARLEAKSMTRRRRR